MIGCQRISLTEVRDIFIFRIYLCQYIYALSYQYCMYFLITAFVGWYTVHIWVFVCVCCAAPDRLTSPSPFTGLWALHRQWVGTILWCVCDNLQYNRHRVPSYSCTGVTMTKVHIKALP